MNTKTPEFQSEHARVKQQIDRSLQLIESSQSCREAVQHLHILVKPSYQGASKLLGIAQFHAKAEQLIEAIIDRQVQSLDSAPVSERFSARCELLCDWRHLRLSAPRLARYADHLVRQRTPSTQLLAA